MARPSRSQPRVTAAVRRLRGSSSASIPMQVGHQLLAPERGLDLGVEALAGGGGPLLDVHHRADRRVAEGRVGVEEVRGDAGEDVPPGQPPERLERGRAQHLVVEEREERRRRPRVADLPEGVEGGVLQPRLPVQRLDEPGHRLRRADLPEAGRGRVAHVDVRVGERLHESAHRGRHLQGAEHHRGEEAHLLVGVGEEREEGGGGGGAEPNVDLHGRVARARVVVVAQRRLERGKEGPRREAGEGLDRGLPHRPALVAHGDEEGGDRLGAPRGAEVGHRAAARGLLAPGGGRRGLGDVEAHVTAPSSRVTTRVERGST